MNGCPRNSSQEHSAMKSVAVNEPRKEQASEYEFLRERGKNH